MNFIISKKGEFIASLIIFIFLISIQGRSQTVTFNDTKVDTLLIKNSAYYEIILSKANGAILYITDLRANTRLTSGSLNQCLWIAQNSDEAGCFSTDFNSATRHFYYQWDQFTTTLTLNYTVESGINEGIACVVKLIASAQDFIDLQITAQNFWEQPLMSLSFPNNLTFNLGTDDQVVLPFNYPGIILESGFFDLHSNCGANYPGGFHSDYLGFGIGAGKLAMYTLTKDAPIRSVYLGLKYIEEESEQGTHFACHNYNQLWIKNGESWTSPLSRIRIGAGFISTLNSCRQDKGINLLPSLQQKLAEKFAAISMSPIFYYAFGESVRKPYKDLAAWAAGHPTPSIAMLSIYYTGGFHGHHPDYLPPEPNWGTTEDFQNMVADLQQQGRLVMPFTLPCWWHEDSPTIKGLSGVTLQDICLLNRQRQPEYGDFGWGGGGYYISPGNSFVVNRMDKMYQDIFKSYGCDLIYEDVIGCLTAGLDFNPYLSSPMDMLDGWLDILKSKSHYLQSVEGGSDRMAEATFAFMGTLVGGCPIVPHEYRKFVAGSKIWHPFPTAPILYHDKIIPMQFWGGTDKEVVAFNVLYGCQFNFSVDDMVPERSSNSPWMTVTRDFQKYVISRLTGKKMTGYEDISTLVSKTVFEDIEVIKNWDTLNNYSTGIHTICPDGVIATSADGTLIAGIFSGFNGSALSAGDHYLIIEKGDTLITVRQSMGEATPICILRPEGWVDSSLITVNAKTKDSSTVTISCYVDESNIQFNLDSMVNEHEITHYEILYNASKPSSITNQKSRFLEHFELEHNFPNPFNSATTIKFCLAATSEIELSVFNLTGQKIRTLINENQPAGNHLIHWDGKDGAGHDVTSGIYIYCIKAEGFNSCLKMLLIR